MTRPKVTILMPVYNGERYLRPAIESIVRQTFSDFELLIIDDGSTDRSLDVAASFVDTRIRIVKNGKNLGLACTLNRAVDLARGIYLARMDADDVSEPQRLERQIQFMELRPDVGVCGTWIGVFGERQPQRQRLPQDHDRITTELIFENCLAHPAVIMRSSVANKRRLYDLAMSHAEDYDLWVRLSQEGIRLANLPKVLLWRRIHNHQIGVTRNRAQNDVANKIREKQLHALGIKPSTQDLGRHLQLALLECSPPTDLWPMWEWIQRIIRANETSRVYHGPTLEKTCKSRFRRYAAVDIRNLLLNGDLNGARDSLRVIRQVDVGWFLWMGSQIAMRPVTSMRDGSILRGKGRSAWTDR